MVDFSTLNDQQLVSLLSESSELAFKEIYTRFWKKLLVVAGRRLNDQQEAEEALQDIFLRLWRRRADLKLKGNLENYFAVAVKFEVINRLAKQSREASRNDAYAYQLNQASHGGYEHLDVELLQQQYDQVLQSLPIKCELIFRMSREQDMTNKEIALSLGLSEKAVEKHKTNALKALRTRFGQFLPIILIFFSK